MTNLYQRNERHKKLRQRAEAASGGLLLDGQREKAARVMKAWEDWCKKKKGGV